MWYDFVLGIVAPFFAYFLEFCGTPFPQNTSVKGSDKKNAVPQKRESIFIKELSGFFLSNVIWGITYTMAGDKETSWIISYFFLFFCSCCSFVIKGNKDFPRWLKNLMFVLFFIALIIISYIRVFGTSLFHTAFVLISNGMTAK